jgi:hypothetical protein
MGLWVGERMTDRQTSSYAVGWKEVIESVPNPSNIRVKFKPHWKFVVCVKMRCKCLIINKHMANLFPFPPYCFPWICDPSTAIKKNLKQTNTRFIWRALHRLILTVSKAH